MRLFLFPLLLLGLPLAEIAGFVMVGRWLGVWPTLGLVILSGLVGATLLRVQGLGVLRQIQTEGREGRVPAEAIIHGALIVFAAILLILPGFLTDIFGLLLFIPPVRTLLWGLIGQKVVVRTGYSASAGPADPFGDRPRNRPSSDRTLDLGSEDYHRKSNPSSHWSNGLDRKPDDRG
ncbi:UPF0716 protein FxsA [Neorhizobium galegae]|uniref:FxsA family protein n=1 Tax=Rhizobium/Agrobacterium group TaxID=227290 RepID=UPI001AE7F8DC|nr:FxsA family protein [Neorhizobium galegae]MBP2551335.1 UPF0716 protein FxsA [Neorhizobium galegae]